MRARKLKKAIPSVIARLVACKEKSGMRYTEIAEALGVHAVTLSSFKNGRSKSVPLEKAVIKWCKQVEGQEPAQPSAPTPATTSTDMTDDEMAAALKLLTRNTSIRAIKATLGMAVHTITKVLHGEAIRASTAATMKAVLMEKFPGVLEEVRKKSAATEAKWRGFKAEKKAKEHATALATPTQMTEVIKMPTALELDMQILEVLQRVRSQLPGTPKVNGHPVHLTKN